MRTSSKKPRLLLLYAPTLRASGVATFTATVARIMEACGWEVTVGLAWGNRFHNPLVFEEQYPGIKTIWMDARTGSEEGRVQAIYRTIRKVSPDVVLHNCLHSVFEAVRRLRRAGRKKFTFCVVNHGSFPEHTAFLLGNLDVVDQVVCVSRWSWLALRSAGVTMPDDRAHHIPNTVPAPTALFRNSDVRPPRIGYAGRLMPDKRFLDIFPFFRTVAAHDPLVELWIAGDGPYAEETLNFCEEFAGRVRYWGAVTRDDLYGNFYPHIDIIVNFSPAEAGKSLAICEAMTLGVVPVVAAFTGIFLEEFLEPIRTALLFPIGETAAAARLTLAVLGDPEKLQGMSTAVRDLMLQGYPVEHFARQWAATLERFLNSSQEQATQSTAAGQESSLEILREHVRRLLHRRFPHRDPGGEWPHFSGRMYPELVEEIKAVMGDLEKDERIKFISRLDAAGSLCRQQAEILRLC